jgi:hypothetical protein
LRRDGGAGKLRRSPDAGRRVTPVLATVIGASRQNTPDGRMCADRLQFADGVSIRRDVGVKTAVGGAAFSASERPAMLSAAPGAGQWTVIRCVPEVRRHRPLP